MADKTNAWAMRGPWNGIVAAPSHFGVEGAADVMVTLIGGMALATLIAAEDPAPLVAAIRKHVGLDLPKIPGRVASASHAIAWTGPSQWMLATERRDGFAALLQTLGTVAAVSDQSAARAVHRIGGPAVREVLSRGFMLDLHEDAFPVGATASTVVAHVGVHIARLPDSGGHAQFEIMVPRSFAGSYWSWLSASAAPFGCRIEAQAA